MSKRWTAAALTGSMFQALAIKGKATLGRLSVRSALVLACVIFPSGVNAVGADIPTTVPSQRDPDEAAILSAYLSNIIATQPDIPNDRIICVDERYIEASPDWNLDLARRLDKGDGGGQAFKSLRKKPQVNTTAEALVSVHGLKLKDVSQETVPGPECSMRPRHKVSRPILYKNRAFVVSYVGKPPCSAYAIVSRVDRIGKNWKVIATQGLYAVPPSVGCGQLWRPSDLNNIKGRYYLIGD